MKLHTKLGKPIPSDNPTVIPPASTGSSPALKKVSAAIKATTFAKPSVPPKLNFVSGKTEYDRFLHTNPTARSATSEGETSTTETFCTTYPASAIGTDSTASSNHSESTEASNEVEHTYVEKDIEPVGMDYIEEIRTDDGRPKRKDMD